MKSIFANTKRFWLWRVILFVGLLAMILTVFTIPRIVTHAASSDTWTTYLGGNGRTGFNGAETVLTRKTASQMKLHWSVSAAGSISAEPVEANGYIYWAAYDGFEYATKLDGTSAWKTYLGVTNAVGCRKIGVASTATIASVSLHGKTTSVAFVGGGDARFYALNATTGAILWQTRLGSSPSHFIWSSPIVYNGSIYIGLASTGDCPLIRGRVLQLNASTGAIEHTFNVVPPTCTGGSVWGSPALDVSDGTLYFVTGNGGSCTQAETLTDALVKLSASNLSLISSWQIPASQQIVDGDFGSTPTLFQATINGVSHTMVGVANKNGVYYAFDRTTISTGPLWQVNIAVGGDTPEVGKGSISPSAWDGSTLYAADGSTTINGKTCAGSVRALNPSSGAFLWQACLPAAVLGAVTAVPGLVIVGVGPSIDVLDAVTGAQLFTFQDKKNGANFWSAACISNGVLYQGDLAGNLFALGL